MTRSRATVLLLVAGAIVLATASAAWLSADVPTVTSSGIVQLAGATVAPATTAAGLVIVAGAIALTIAGTALARTTAAVVAATSLAALAQGAAVVADPAHTVALAAARLSGVAEAPLAVDVLPAAWGGLAALAVAAGVAVGAVAAAGRWVPQRTRFERRPATGADARGRAMDDWDALGRGEDPSRGEGNLGRKEDRDG